MNLVQNSIYIIFTSFWALFETQKFGGPQLQVPTENFLEVARPYDGYLKDTPVNNLSNARTLVRFEAIQEAPTYLVQKVQLTSKKERLL